MFWFFHFRPVKEFSNQTCQNNRICFIFCDSFNLDVSEKNENRKTVGGQGAYTFYEFVSTGPATQKLEIREQEQNEKSLIDQILDPFVKLIPNIS